jgi:hypothetical protein
MFARAPTGPDRFVAAFSVRSLPKSAAGRFTALFAQRHRWTRDEIDPYLEARPPSNPRTHTRMLHATDPSVRD